MIRNHLREQGRQVKGQIIGTPATEGLRPGKGQNAFVLEFAGVKVSLRYSPMWDQWTATHVNPFGQPIKFGSGGYYSAGTTVKALVEDIKARIGDALIDSDRAEADEGSSPPPSAGCPTGTAIPW